MKDKNPILVNLGDNIAKRRRAIGLTAADLAHRAGVAATSIRDIERGAAEGNLLTRHSIAEVLNCNISDLYLNTSDASEKVNHAEVASLVSQLLRLVHYPQRRRALALFFLTGKEDFLDEYIHASDPTEPFDLDRKLRALQKLKALPS